MAPSDFPSSFGFPVFIKIFLPGFITTVLYTFAIVPIFVGNFWINFNLYNEIIFLAVLGMIVGMVLTSLETYIYQFFEGIRFWPEKIWIWKYNKIKNEFELIESKLKNYKKYDTFELYKLRSKILEYPFDVEKKYKSERFPAEATRFGNVMAEYETHSERYGMQMKTFWPHIRLIIPTEVKDEIDIKGAKVDFLVYLSFVFLISSPIFAVGLAYQLVDACFTLHPQLNITYQKIDLFIMLLISVFFISVLISYMLYEISIRNLIYYGQYVKAIVDIYRPNLARKFGICADDINRIPDKKEIEIWKDLDYFLRS